MSMLSYRVNGDNPCVRRCQQWVCWIRRRSARLCAKQGVGVILGAQLVGLATVALAASNRSYYASLTADEVASQRWTRSDFEQTLADSRQWFESDIGRVDYAPPPWTPMQVEAQSIVCWGRTYTYDNSILPVQVTSQGVALYAGPPTIELVSNGETYVFKEADIHIEKVHDGLVAVRALAKAGPYRLELNTAYEFDGMAKVKLRLWSETGAGVDRAHLLFPLRAEQALLYNLTGARYGLELQYGGGPAGPPLCRSGAVPEEGMTLDTFREVIWIGDRDVGFSWFAESLQGWRIQDERAIQEVRPVANGKQVFALKLADRPSSLSTPLEVVFGLMATPMRPRADDFRSLYQKYHFQWKWWEGYNTIELDTFPEEARQWIAELRAQGREFMPYRSLEYMGNCRYYKVPFGVVKNPAMYLREIMLWGDMWGIPYQGIPAMAARGRSQRSVYVKSDYSPQEALAIKEEVLKERASGMLRGRSVDEVMAMRHTPDSDTYFGRLFKPQEESGRRGEVILYRFYPDSPFKDYHIWKLDQAVKQAGLRAIYFDQQLRASLDPHNANGYIDYRGEWAPETPLFAMREAMKRIYVLFWEHNQEPPLIKWHCSLQKVVPALSFVDIVWEGEKYHLGPEDFYSNLLSESEMQVMHLGRQFGYTPFFLTMFHRTPRTPLLASIRDETGLLLIHDAIGAIGPVHHRNYINYIFDKWSSYPHEQMETAYYWEEDNPIAVHPTAIKPVLHYDKDMALLILFNWSSETQRAHVHWEMLARDPARQINQAEDVVSGCRLEVDGDHLYVDLLPRDFRMIEVRWGDLKETGSYDRERGIGTNYEYADAL